METIISTYEQQAIDFLNATKTQFKTQFEKFDYYFPGEKRNIFKVMLKNEKHKYRFRFGSSLTNSLKNPNDVSADKEIDFYFGLKHKDLKNEYLSYSDKILIEEIKDKYTKNQSRLLLNKKKATDIYNEFVKGNTNKYISRLNIISLAEWLDKLEGAIIRKASELAEKNFGEGIPKENVIYPTAYDVLTCLQKYDPGTFENFCGDFGYDSDSRSAYKTYKAVIKEWKNIEFLFSTEQMEQLQEIQ